MSLDGLRAWIGEVERKLAMRTRVFLVLLAIAIGGSGAAIYLALEAEENNSGGEAGSSEVAALREQVQTAVSTLGQVATLEAQVAELKAKVEQLEGGSAGGRGAGSNGGGPSVPGSGTNGGGPSPAPEAAPIPETEAK